MADAGEVTSHLWRNMPMVAKARAIHEALDHQARLLSVLGTLSSTEHDGKWPENVLSTLKRDAHGMQEFFSAFLSSKFYNERHAEGSPNRPSRLFDSPKLVEYILRFLSIADLFTMRGANRALRNMIDGSEVLQNEMHLNPMLDESFVTPFELGSECARLTRLTCGVVFTWNTAFEDTEQVPRTYAAAVEVRYDASLSRLAVPSKSYAYRAMCICQPPPLEMDVFPDCCARYNYSASYSIYGTDPLNAFLGLGRLQPAGKVVSATGITVGDLYDAIERIRVEHRLCPKAQEVASHDEAGNYWPNISFGCLLKVKDNDPVLNPRIQAGCISRTPPPPPDWRILEYMDAKQQAYAAGRPILTLAEFEAGKLKNTEMALSHNRTDSAFQTNEAMAPETTTDANMDDDRK